MRTRHGTSFDHLMSFLILSSLTYSINIYVHDAYQEVAGIAQWEDEQIEYIKEKVTEEGRQEDLKKGKAPAQIALDEAAFLLDLASIEGNWVDSVERIAECYKEAGLNEIARFILYRD